MAPADPIRAAPDDGLTLRVRIPTAGRFAGTVDAEGGAGSARGFDGWVDFMGAVAELRQRTGRPRATG